MCVCLVTELRPCQTVIWENIFSFVQLRLSFWPERRSCRKMFPGCPQYYQNLSCSSVFAGSHSTGQAGWGSLQWGSDWRGIWSPPGQWGRPSLWRSSSPGWHCRSSLRGNRCPTARPWGLQWLSEVFAANIDIFIPSFDYIVYWHCDIMTMTRFDLFTVYCPLGTPWCCSRCRSRERPWGRWGQWPARPACCTHRAWSDIGNRVGSSPHSSECLGQVMEPLLLLSRKQTCSLQHVVVEWLQIERRNMTGIVIKNDGMKR